MGGIGVSRSVPPWTAARRAGEMGGWLAAARDWFVDWHPGDREMTVFETRVMWRVRIEYWAGRLLLCPLRGHRFIPDHCCRLEHDYCLLCGHARGDGP
jgi:hypothetical protein